MMGVWEIVWLSIMGAGIFFCLSPFLLFCLAVWWKAMKAALEEFN